MILNTSLVALGLLALTGVDATNVKVKRCTVKHNKNGKDDSENILKAFKDCSKNAVITFDKADYNAHTPISMTGLKNVVVHLNGNLNLPKDMKTVQERINVTLNQPSTYATPWFYFQGEDVSIIGSQDFKWGRFNGYGQQWWDIGNRVLRPQLATFNVTGGLLRDLKVIKPIAWGWNLPGRNILVRDHFVDAMPNNGTRDDTISFPFNTDGFNLSGHNITVDGYYGHNGDDCVSVINGAQDIVAKNGYCGFSSHGLSIGSLGRNGAVHTVKNVLFKNWTMEGAVYGARFKSWTGGQGSAENIAWEDITLIGVSTGVFITQNFKNFKGTLGTSWTDGTCISDPCWNYVPGLDEVKSVIFDLYAGTAVNITLSGIDIRTRKNSKKTNVICDPTTLVEGEQDTLGFQCANGPFIATPIKKPGKPRSERE